MIEETLGTRGKPGVTRLATERSSVRRETTKLVRNVDRKSEM
jgi:hypothetical protein